MPLDDGSKIYLLGPADLTLGGVGIGHCKDLALDLTFEDVASNVAMYGKSPIDVWHLAVMVKIKGTMSQVDYATYAKLMQGQTYLAGNAGGVGLGVVAGVRMTPSALVITPVQAAVATLGKLTLFRVVPDASSGGIQWNEKLQELKFTLVALIQESSPSGQKYGIWGDPTASVISAAPTMTLVPVNGATGVSDAANTVVVTFNTPMNPGSINAGTFMVFPYAESAAAPLAGAITVDTTGAIYTFTYAGTWGASAKFEVVLSKGIQDASGNAFAGQSTVFTST